MQYSQQKQTGNQGNYFSTSTLQKPSLGSQTITLTNTQNLIQNSIIITSKLIQKMYIVKVKHSKCNKNFEFNYYYEQINLKMCIVKVKQNKLKNLSLFFNFVTHSMSVLILELCANNKFALKGAEK
eukprot:TRINITY_DN15033_c1_g1_i4.p2 TRINITY_DN15033_c1_g1~~TRINITY_DN15033_c1_g1_i4.p2  ORF type:complete len:126 (-),score=4.33 TRINITY_DN15033_c1_g1_i4:273-650(-)